MQPGIDARPLKKPKVLSAADCSVGSVGMTGSSDGTTPTTKFNLSADRVTTQDRFGNKKTYLNVSASVDISVVAQVGGRDQSSAFSAAASVKVFWVPNGSGSLGLVASLNSFTTLPNGHSEAAPAINLKLNPSAQIIQGTVAGNYFQTNSVQSVVTAGSSAFATPVSYAALVPVEALDIFFISTATASTNASGAGSVQMNLGATANSLSFATCRVQVASGTDDKTCALRMAQTSDQTIRYGSSSLTGNISAYSQTVYVNGYTMRNGAR